MGSDFDALVIGSGPDGLAAANLLADAGWSVVALEAQDHIGGAVQGQMQSRSVRRWSESTRARRDDDVECVDPASVRLPVTRRMAMYQTGGITDDEHPNLADDIVVAQGEPPIDGGEREAEPSRPIAPPVRRHAAEMVTSAVGGERC